jgi:hypothetical protein
MRPDASHISQVVPKRASSREADILPHDLPEDIGLVTPAYMHRAWWTGIQTQVQKFCFRLSSAGVLQATALVDDAG